MLFSIRDVIVDIIIIINDIINNINNIINDINNCDEQLCHKPGSLLVKMHKLHWVSIEKKTLSRAKVLILRLHQSWSTFLNALAGKCIDISGAFIL